MRFFLRCSIRPWLFILGVAACSGARADDRVAGSTPLLPQYQQECAGCHIAYPPRLLPAASWQRLLDNLPRHFGTDASLDAETVKRLAAWLTANAGTGVRAREAPPQDRITRSAWFLHEHDDEVPAATWKLPSVNSAANCSACHTQADQGVFDDHTVRIPR